jgi:hypothetical protein
MVKEGYSGASNMLSGRLIRLIKDHQEQIATNVIREIRQHSDLWGSAQAIRRGVARTRDFG